MGDADVGAGGGASSLDSGDAGSLAASRALMEGGSLPPRKRLLAGLKQNGWLSTSPPPVVSPTALGHAGGVGTQAAGGESVVRSGSGKYEDGCMGCNAVESNGLRRIKRGGVLLRLCTACTLLYSKSMFCPHCLAMYHDASLLGDPSMWLVCSRCRRSVHPECEQKHSGSTPDPASYVCLDCVNSSRRQRESNGLTGMRSKHSSGRPVSNAHGEGRAGASAGLRGDFVSPAVKKPRMSRERSSRPEDHERADGSKLEKHRSGSDAAGATGVGKAGSLVPPRKPPSQAHSEAASPQEAAVAARNAATAAAKVAVAAKANAAAKAAASVRAAAVAKAALETAAHASRADAAARVELRRKLASAENRLAGGGPMRLEINVHSEPRRERSSKGEMKYERDDGYVPRRAGAGSVDDEELARQLHRVINSSPRISRSMTPMRRKAPVKPETPSSGVSNSSAETVRVRPQASSAEPAHEQVQGQHEHEQKHHSFKHQQTRPRSVTHKELRRIDTRVSRHDMKMAEDGNGQEGERVGGLDASGHEASLIHGGGHSAEELVSGVKSEGMDGPMFAPVGVQDDASILFDALVEADNEGMHAAGGGGESQDRRPDYLQEILEAAVLTDTAMFNDGVHEVVSDVETVRSESEIAARGQETLVTSDLDAEANEGGPKDQTGGTGEDVAPEAVGQEEESGSTVVHDVEMQEVGGGDAPPVVEEDPKPGPAVLSESRPEERPGGNPAEEVKTEADASKETRMEADASKETRMEADASKESRMEADASKETRVEADASKETRVEADASKETRVEADASKETRVEADASKETRVEADASKETRMETDACKETMTEADAGIETKPEADASMCEASTTTLVEVEVPSTGSDEGKSGACESGAQVASAVTATGLTSEQSG